jgi:hypothetical protein
MLVSLSGGRGDGTQWPPAGGTLDVGDREGMELCTARLAIPVTGDEDPETRPASDAAEYRGPGVAGEYPAAGGTMTPGAGMEMISGLPAHALAVQAAARSGRA